MDTIEPVSDDIQAEGSAADSSTAEPQSTTDDAAPATEAPVVTEAKKADEYGPLPFERHHAILEKTRRDYDERLSRLSWAEGLTREQVERAIALDQLYRTNPDRLAAHLSERVKASEAPQPDVKDERGEWFYSPAQAAKLARFEATQAASALREELEGRFGPIEADFTHGQQIRALDAQISQAEQWPGFTENLAEITAAITDVNDRRARGERIPKLSLHEAYISIVPTKLLSTQEATIAERVKKKLTELNQTTQRVKDDVNPGRAPAGTRKKEEDMTDAELLEYFSNQPANAR